MRLGGFFCTAGFHRYDHRVSRLYAVLAASILGGTGCASQLSIVKSDNARLRTMVTELRADKRRAERRVRELEGELAEQKGANPSRAAAPPLPVEVLAPEPSAADDGLAPGQRIVGIADDGTAIIYEGDAASGRAATWGDDDVDEPAAPPPPRARAVRAPAPASGDRIATTGDRIPTVASATAAEKARDGEAGASVHMTGGAALLRGAAGVAAAELYKAGVDLLRAGRHDSAVVAFRDLVARYRDHDLADNAQYWIGEAYYARKDFTAALAEFRIAVDRYPRGNKVPDALLKVGYCHLALGQADKGRFALEQVMTIYPKTEPALLAEKRLESLAP
jgi:tol-pal system protein YbgF